VKYTLEDIRRADNEMEDLSESALKVLDEHHGMHLMEHLGVDDRDLVMYCIEKEMEQSEVAFFCAGFSVAMRMVYNKENEVA
jgi:hypothetical protein